MYLLCVGREGWLTVFRAVDDAADGLGVLAHNGLFAGREINPVGNRSQRFVPYVYTRGGGGTDLLTWRSIPAV